MTPVDRARLVEPDDFDEKCRQPGHKWLAANQPCKRPRDFWTPFKPILADCFRNLCAYSAMYEPVGTVDHFVSFNENPLEAYEWRNYRYASGWINSCKSKAQGILDPLLVEEGWFRILLPSLQMVVTDRVPDHLRPIAEDTLRRLRLSNDERVMRQRREWYRMFQAKEITLEGLRTKAPLIAAAIAQAGI